MIYLPITYNNIINDSEVQLTGDVDYTVAVLDIASNKYLLNNITIQSESKEQLQQLIFYNQTDLTGGSTVNSKQPLMDSYQKQSILRNLKINDWQLDGKSTVGYNLLPNEQVRIILELDMSESKEKLFKENTRAKTTFEMELDELQIGDQCREPEEEKLKSIPIAMIEIAKMNSSQIELGVKEYQEEEYITRQKMVEQEDTEPDEPLCIERMPTPQELLLARANGEVLEIPNCYEDIRPIQITNEKSRGIFAKVTVPLEEEKTIPQLLAELKETPSHVIEGFEKEPDQEYIERQDILEKSKGIFAKTSDFQIGIPLTQLLINKAQKNMATQTETPAPAVCKDETKMYLRWLVILGSIGVGLAIVSILKPKAQ